MKINHIIIEGYNLRSTNFSDFVTTVSTLENVVAYRWHQEISSSFRYLFHGIYTDNLRTSHLTLHIGHHITIH